MMHQHDVQVQHHHHHHHHHHVVQVHHHRGEVKRGRGRYCTDLGLGFSINTVLQQHLHHLNMIVITGLVQWCPATLWDDASV